MGRLGFDLVRSKEKAVEDSEANRTLDLENEDDDGIPTSESSKRRLRHYEPSKKMYLLFFVSTTVVACFCIFVVIPQLIDYFTSPSVLKVGHVYAAQEESVIELLDTESSRRNRERLEIMEKFDSLQQSYKMLQLEFERAKEVYLKKLHNAYDADEQNTTTPDEKDDTTEQSGELEIFELDNELMNIHEDKSERPTK